MIHTVAGQRLLITGAAMGMGRIYAQKAVAEGAAAVVLWDINQTELDKTVAELAAKGGQVRGYVVDVASIDAVSAAAARVRAEVGHIDILINNAGVIRGKYFWEHDVRRDIEFTMAINALAPMVITREFLPAMIEQRGREQRVVNIASAAGLVSNPKMSVYCGSKWAATGWSDSVRIELEEAGHTHVAVTTVNPTYIATGMFEGAKPMLFTPIMTPEHVTDRVWAAMKSGRPRLIMPWTVYLSSALKGLLPLRLYDWLARHVFGVYGTMASFKGHAGN